MNITTPRKTIVMATNTLQTPMTIGSIGKPETSGVELPVTDTSTVTLLDVIYNTNDIFLL